MQTEKAKSSHFDRTRGFKNQIFPTQEMCIETFIRPLRDDRKLRVGDQKHLTFSEYTVFC